MSGRSAVRGALIAAVLGLGLLAGSGVAAAEPENREFSVASDSVRITSDGDIAYGAQSTDWT
ncbi:hypothetical protein [Pseudonocardia sp. TRM90224]|uniref:hypothetical protein n=1 Tax=Pseudonocardia sp. TRM90224 TaxID=2812678 RepID=UPI001E3E7DD8|nr:hypothetical protein [Pseudonocardia sp. TRM90224]